jgi:hypothetical protein
MNDGGNADQRRARLRAMRERYEQHPAELAETIPPASEPVAAGESRRARHRPGGPDRAGERDQAERSKGGGLLQRLSQFLMEPSPGDSPLAGTGIGERRLQQAVAWLEQRSRTTQGAAGERIQRLLRFLKQDIPGEPMRAGVNLKRLQQLLERAGTPSMAPAPAVASESPAIERAELVPPPPATDAEPAMATDPKPSPTAEPETAGEIAFIEETLSRLRAVTQGLERRLDEIRRQGETATGGATKGRLGDAAPARNPADGARPPAGPAPQADSGSALTAQSRPESDDWFLQFLE